MTDSLKFLKWFKIKWVARIALLAITLPAAYVVLQTEYNFAHWVPHSLLRDIGIPYQIVLKAESNADKVLHPLVAFVVTVLLWKSSIPIINRSKWRLFFCLCFIILGAELWQFQIGRGFEFLDLTLGFFACLAALAFLVRSEAKQALKDKID